MSRAGRVLLPHVELVVLAAAARIVVGEGSLILDRPLDYDHAVGEMVARIPQQHVAQAFGTAPVDESTPWFRIVALLVAVGLGARAMMVWRTDRSS